MKLAIDMNKIHIFDKETEQERILQLILSDASKPPYGAVFCFIDVPTIDLRRIFLYDEYNEMNVVAANLFYISQGALVS